MGNEDRADDVAGKLVVDLLRKSCKEEKSGTVHALWGATVPESMSRGIREARPSHVVIVDAVDTGRPSGDVVFYGIDKIDSVPTAHTTSPALLAQFLGELGAQWAVIGIQPGNLCYLGKVTAPVKRSARIVAATIKRLSCRNLG
jgi:hydrogenase 3 maturation protease